MTILIAALIVTWIVMAALAVLLVAVARQVGTLHERIAPAGALAVNAKLEPGSMAAEYSAKALSGREVRIGGLRAKSQLLFFVAPDCPVCKILMPVLKSVAEAEKDNVEIVLMSDGDEEAHRRYVVEQRLEQFEYVLSEIIGKAFGVSKLPYAILIGEDGRIASLGIVNTREHLESLFEAKERGVSSLQDYLQRRAQQRN